MTDDILKSLPILPEEELEQIFRMSIHCICIADINTTNFLQVNPAFETILGYKPKELINRSFLDFIHPDDVQSTIDIVEKALKKGKKVIHFENRYKRKNGTYVWFDWVSHPDVSKGITYAIASDVTEKKQIEIDLANSERKFRTLFEKSSDPMLTLENGVFTDCNNATLKLLGYKSKKDITGKRPHELSPEYQPDGTSSLKKAQQYIQQAREKLYARFEWMHTDREGHSLWIDVSLTDISDQGEDKLFTIWRNITEKKLAEKALIESEDRFKQLFNHMADGVAIYQPDENGMHFYFVDINRAGEELSSVKKQEIIGKLLHDVFPGANDYGLVDAMREVYKTGKPEFIPIKEYKDLRIAQWVENYIFKLPSGNLVCIYNDTSKEKQAMIDMQAYRDRLDLAMESANQGIWEWNLQSNKVTFDKIAAMMLGYENQPLTTNGEEALSWIHPESYNTVMDTFNDYIENKIPQYQVEFRIKRKDGQYIWVLSNGRIIRRDENQKPILVVGMHQNITKRKTTESELLKYKNHLEELVKERTLEIEEKNKELERMNNLFVGREFRIKELREKIRELNERLEKNNQ
ncbi:MAG: PAS domain S-box protein [Bacteroidetes bacterium]|nr:PAS domain S-box protein [Bacteroidota bacterium]